MVLLKTRHARHGSLGTRQDELPVAAVAHPRSGRDVPEVPEIRVGDLVQAEVGKGHPAPRVDRGPGLLDEVRRDGAHRPLVAVGADLGVDVEVVEQNEPLGEGVMIRCDLSPEQGQLGISLALWQITEDLIVGPVLLADVEHVFDE